MKIGICCGFDRAKLVKDAGYDYVEENFTALRGLSDSQFDELKAKYKQLGIPVLSTNCFFPWSFDLYGENYLERIRDHASVGLKRASELGIKTCVLGSGGARKVPEGSTKEQTEEKFVKILSLLGDLAKPYGISIAIEPLAFHETDVVNFVSEADRLAKSTGKDNVGCLVDFFHFFMNGDTVEGLLASKGTLLHAHVARGNKDRRPPSDEDIPDVIKWANALKEAGYTGNISLEASYGDDFDTLVPKTLPYLTPFKNI